MYFVVGFLIGLFIGVIAMGLWAMWDDDDEGD